MGIPEFNLFTRDLLPAGPVRAYRPQWMVFVLSVVLVAGAWYASVRPIPGLLRKQQVLAAQRLALERELAGVQEEEALLQELRQRQNLAAALQGETWSARVERLRDLAAKSGVNVETVSLQRGKLTVRGRAAGLAGLAPYLGLLERDPSFSAVELQDVSGTVEGETNVDGKGVEFTLEVYLQAPSGGQGVGSGAQKDGR